MKRATLEHIRRSIAERRSITLVTHLESNEQWLYTIGATTSGRDSLLPDALPDALPERLCEELAGALGQGRASTQEGAAGRFFVQPFRPRPRLIVVGAVHIAQHLAAIARRLEHDVTVVDPRSAFATAARFPGTALRAEWPERALASIGIDERCAVVTLSHDPKIDDPALDCALTSDAYYIGCLGSQRTQARRRDRLAALGHSAESLRRLHGPVGLDLGASSPAEIALSIAAELTQQLRQPGR